MYYTKINHKYVYKFCTQYGLYKIINGGYVIREILG
jgi:hypothetical protein